MPRAHEAWPSSVCHAARITIMLGEICGDSSTLGSPSSRTFISAMLQIQGKNLKNADQTKMHLGSKMELHSQTKVTAVEDVVACEVADGTALLNLSTSRYYKLNETAALIWTELEKSEDRSHTISHLISVVEKRYDVDESVCREDVISLFEILFNANLVRFDFS